MKLAPVFKCLCSLAIALFLAQSTASARPPRAQKISGTVQSIDAGQHTVVVLPHGNPPAVTYHWPPSTELPGVTAGQAVVLRVRTPFFGKPWVSAGRVP